MKSKSKELVFMRNGQRCVGAEAELALDVFARAVDGDVATFLEDTDVLEDMGVEVFDLTYTGAQGHLTDVLWAAWTHKHFAFVQMIAGAAIAQGRRPGVVFAALLPNIVERAPDNSEELTIAMDLLGRMLRHIVEHTGPVEMLRERDGYAAGPRGQEVLSLVCAEKIAEDERDALSSDAPDPSNDSEQGSGPRRL